MRCGFSILAIIVLAQFTWADTITLKSGSKIECTVISEGERVTFRKGASTFAIPQEQIQSIRREAVPPATTRPAAIDGARLPSVEEVLTALGRQAWAKDIEQIPATVVDVGVLKHVPYASHRCGDYEINVYGNPDAPACVEIGVYRQLLEDPAAKQQCISFLSSMLGRDRAAAFSRMNRQKDSVTIGEWTLEITPPTDADAYGGWWVSVYSDKLLNGSRASQDELKAITMSKRSAKRGTPVAVAIKVSEAKDDPPAGEDDWTETEMAKARSASTPSHRTTGGDVYVRGYTRKDGTYVRGYTRSSSRSRR